MKKFYLVFLTSCLILGSYQNALAQCEPDTTLPDTAGIFPLGLANGAVGEPYLQTINFVFPTEITIDVEQLGPVFANLCAYQLDSVSNLPEGLDFECNTDDCSWDINFEEGFVNRGCVNISGVPTSRVLPDDSLRIFLTITPGSYDEASETCVDLQLSEDIIRQYAIQEFRVPFIITGDTLTTSLKNLTQESLRMQVFPNPATYETTLEFRLPEASEATVEVLNLIGKKVLVESKGKLNSGVHRIPIQTQDWTSGMYFVRLNLGEGSQTFIRKLTVN